MICNICGCDKFIGLDNRPFRVCHKCGAMERQRFLAEYIKTNIKNVNEVLEIAPLNKFVFGDWFKLQYNCNYTSVDKWRTGNPADPRAVGFIDRCVGMEDLLKAFGHDKFDLVIFQHVLEEINEYKIALQNVKDILKPHGIALMEIPMKSRGDHTHSSDNHFGNVWNFGMFGMAEDLSIFSDSKHIPMSIDGFKSDLFVVVK